jgi:hypothetical protein
VDRSRIRVRTSAGAAGRPVRARLFQLQNRRKPRRCQAMTVSGLIIWTDVRQPHHARESHTQNSRSVDVRRRRGRWRRFDDSQLMSERDDFEVQRGAGPNHQPEGIGERDDDRDHELSLFETGRNLNPDDVYRVSDTHRRCGSIEHSRDGSARFRAARPSRRVHADRQRDEPIRGSPWDGGNSSSRAAPSGSR